jgi:SAM-dependent methyltransferase
MGIPSQFARILLREHRRRRITGTILSIGKQTVYLSAAGAVALVGQESGAAARLTADAVELDHGTRGAQGRQLISDRGFYSLFTDAGYECLDVTGYEGANLIVDLCAPLPAELEGRFDFIVNAMALRNLTRLLKPGGRIVHLERASRTHNVYVAFALSWFYDYYALNEFADCQAYLAQWDDLIAGRWDIYQFSPILETESEICYFGEDRYYFPHRHAHAIVIAEKGSGSTADRSPVQFGYRPGMTVAALDGRGLVASRQAPAEALDPYFRAALRFLRNSPPPIVSDRDKVELPAHLFHYDPRIPYRGSIHPLLDGETP